MEDHSYPVSLSSLHFPSAEHGSVSQTLSSLRRSALSIPNRLRSIETDADFVQHVANHYGLPLVANERCGSWYISPETKACSAYFKSTDGHTGQWDFSLRRLNLQVLPVARQYGGCIIVDSTRRGKLMPDALSKTVPIWCAVINRTLFPAESRYHAIRFPSGYLGKSEESQIENKIDAFVKSFKGLKLDFDDLRQKLGKPILVSWANRAYFYPPDLYKAEISEGGYIQGAGDDSEGWSYGLTPPVFWANKSVLLGTAEEDLPDMIRDLVEQYRRQDVDQAAVLIKPTRNIYIGQTDSFAPSKDSYDLLIDCHGDPIATEGNAKRLNLGCAHSKLGSRDLRKSLGKVQAFVSTNLASDSAQSLLVTCDTGKDFSAGVVLSVLCLFYNENGEFIMPQAGCTVDKQFIRQRLAWIVSSKHDANPSRSTLQSVNAFLMQRPEY